MNAGSVQPQAKRPARIGVILTPDNASDPELAAWCPPGTTIHTTRLPLPDDWAELDMTEQSLRLSEPELVAASVRALVLIEPDVVTYACTSGGFVRSQADDERLRGAMRQAGARKAMTTIEAMLDAFKRYGAPRIGLVTPYDERCSRRLAAFVMAAGYEVSALHFHEPAPGATSGTLTSEELWDLARAARRPETDLIFLSCTALPTREVIGPLSRELGLPVLSSTQVTMEAAVAAVRA